MKKLIYILAAFLYTQIVYAQACCTAGTPLLGSLEMSTTKKGVWQFGLNYEYNSLQDVYEGSSQLIDQTRERITQSILFEVNYGFSSKITLTGLFSFVNQQRLIDPLTGSNNSLTINGIGDLMFLVKYNILSLSIVNRNELAVGAGIKAPTGQSDVKSNGILVPADMQPGTGSWDIILWSFYSHANLFEIPLNLLVNISYRINNTNPRFGSQFSTYKFGNEFISTIGFVYLTGGFFDPSLFVRIRHTAQDQFSLGDIPNTGGNWINLVPGFNLNLIDNFTLRASGQIPIYRDLIGTQLTTTLTASLAFTYVLKVNNPFEL